MTSKEQKEAVQAVVQAIWGTLESPNECDRNLENANVVDGLFAIARSVHHLASAVEKGLQGFAGSPRIEDRPADGPSLRDRFALRSLEHGE